MKGFHTLARGISHHETASTTVKKIPNWTVGNSTATPARPRSRAPLQLGRPGRIGHAGRQTSSAIAAALAVLAVAAVASPASAQGGCGGVQAAAPTRHHGPGAAPLAIGDSTMLLALPYLAREGFEVNAHGCREYDEALALLRGLRAGRRLP